MAVKFSGANMNILKHPACLKDQKWPDDVKPVVSISCTVYNQKRYIERCIDGFLSQETMFPVEILIHDDASTDGTTEIIKKYQSEYPQLIRLTCQVENQFSKGKMVNEDNFRKARGNYIALCHGDDYWIDNRKLEKQLSVMKELGVSLCGHPAKEIDVDGNDLNRLTGFQVTEVERFHPNELIRRNGNMLPFGSIMITSEAKNDLLGNMPPVMFHTGIQMLSALRGGLAVIPEPMSVYRTNVPGSTTEIMLGNRKKKLLTAEKRVRSIKRLKRMYGKEFVRSFDALLAKQVAVLLVGRIDRHSVCLLGSILYGEKVDSKFYIFSMIIYFYFKINIARISRKGRSIIGG